VLTSADSVPSHASFAGELLAFDQHHRVLFRKVGLFAGQPRFAGLPESQPRQGGEESKKLESGSSRGKGNRGRQRPRSHKGVEGVLELL